jgi:hypothetical protein
MSTQRITALFLMAAGFGWTAGNFAQPDKPLGVHVFTTLIHALPIVLTLLFAVPLLQHRDGGPRWALRGVSALAALYTVGLVGVIAYSVVNPDPNAFGIHTLADAEPATVMAAGNLLWLASLGTVWARAARSSRTQAA